MQHHFAQEHHYHTEDGPWNHLSQPDQYYAKVLPSHNPATTAKAFPRAAQAIHIHVSEQDQDAPDAEVAADRGKCEPWDEEQLAESDSIRVLDEFRHAVEPTAEVEAAPVGFFM